MDSQSEVSSSQMSAVSDSSVNVGDSDEKLGLGSDYRKQSNLEETLFHILMALSSQKIKTVRYSVLHYVLDWIQMIAFVLVPSIPWGSMTKSIFQNVSKVQLQYLIAANTEYFIYEIIFIFLCLIMISTFVLFTFVQRDYRRNQSSAGWFAVLFIRRIIMPFFDTLYISVLGYFLLPLQCSYNSGTSVNNFFSPPVQCFSMPHILIYIVSIMMIVFYIPVACAFNIVKFEFGYQSKLPLACRMSDQNLRSFFFKTVLCLANSFLPYTTPFYLSLFIFYIIFKMTLDVATIRTFNNNIVNGLNCGLYGLLLWCSFVQVIAMIRNNTGDDVLLWVMVGGAVPAICGGIAINYLQDAKFNYNKWVEESTEENGFTVIKQFHSENEVEIVVRECLKASGKDDFYSEKAEAIFVACLQDFNSSSGMHISYSIFLDTIKGDKSGSKLHFDQALRLSPSIQERFALYKIEQEMKLQQNTASTGDNSMDLVSYIEFQGHYSNALKSHKKLLGAIRQFWKVICRSDNPSIDNLSLIFENIDKLEESTFRIYRGLLRKYPKSIPLLRSYANFLVGVQNEHRKSRKYYLEADRLEEAAEQLKKESSFGDMKSMSSATAVDDKVDSIIVIDEAGIIKSVNKNTKQMFGYHEAELVNHNVSIIMPAPYKQQHNGYLSKYKQTKKSSVIGVVRRLEAEHKKGFTFSIELRVSRVDSSMGPTFVGIIHQLKVEEQFAQISINTIGNIISSNKILLEYFGYSSNEIMGKNVKMLMPSVHADKHDGYLKNMRENSSSSSDLTVKELSSRHLEGLHKSGITFPISITLFSSKVAENDIISAKIVRLSGEVAVITINDKGKIQSVNDTFLRIFGYKNQKKLVNKNVRMIMPEPYRSFHDTYLKRYATTGVPRFLNSESGRYINAKHSDGTIFPIHLSLMEIVDESTSGINYAGRIKLVNAEESIKQSTLTLKADSKGIIITASLSWDKLGYDSKDLIGKNVKTLMPPSVADFHDGYIESYLKSRVKKVVNAGFRNNFLKHSNGLHFPISISLEEEEVGRNVNFFATCRLLDSLEAIIEINQVGIILSINADTCSLFGYSFAELAGKNVKMFMPEEIAINHDFYLQKYKETKVRKIIGNRRVVVGRHKSGSELDIFIEVAEFNDSFLARVQAVTPNNSAFVKESEAFNAFSDEEGSHKRSKKIKFKEVSKKNLLVDKAAADTADYDDEDITEAMDEKNPSNTNSITTKKEAETDGPKKEIAGAPGDKNNRITSRQLGRLYKNYGLKNASKYLKYIRDVLIYCIVFVISVVFVMTIVLTNENNDLLNRIQTCGERSDIALKIAIQTRALQVASISGSIKDQKLAQTTLNTLASSFEVAHRRLFLGTDSISEISYLPLLEQYRMLNVTLLEWVDTTPPYQTSTELDLWDAGRKFADSAWVLAYATDLTALETNRFWRFIIENIDELILQFDASQSLELANYSAQQVLFNYLEMGSAAFGILVPIILLLFVMQPVFRTVYKERVFMYLLFMSFPKRVAHGLTRSTAFAVVGDGASSVGDDDKSSIDDSSSVGSGGEHSSATGGEDKEDDKEDGKETTGGNEVAPSDKKNVKLTKQEKSRRIEKKLQAILGERGGNAGNTVNNRNNMDQMDDQDENTSSSTRSILPFKLILYNVLIVACGMGCYAANYYFGLKSNSATMDVAAASQRRHLLTQMYFVAQELIFVKDNGTYITQQQYLMVDLVEKMSLLHYAILHGNSSLGLDGTLYRYSSQNSLLFDGYCMETNGVCDQTDIFKYIGINGMDAALLFYIEQCKVITYQKQMNLNASVDEQWIFIRDYGPSNIENALIQSTDLFASEASLYFTLGAVAEFLKIGCFLIILYFANRTVFLPATSKIKTEMKRTMAMLSFLPTDIDVKQVQQEQQEKLELCFPS